jgi:acyl-coenzyme A thioesterase 13
MYDSRETLQLSVDLSVVGKTLAYTSIRFTNAKGDLVARGSHTK